MASAEDEGAEDDGGRDGEEQDEGREECVDCRRKNNNGGD